MSKHITLQKFRLKAIEAELTALAAQEEALGQISIEHHCGIDLGCNISVAHFAGRARDLVASLKQALAQFSSLSQEAGLAVVDSFELNAKKLKEDVQELIAPRDREAKRHLVESLAQGKPKRGPLDMAIVPDTEGELKVQAHLHCQAAETEEIRCFVTQIVALCDLCLETVCVGAEGAEQ